MIAVAYTILTNNFFIYTAGLPEPFVAESDIVGLKLPDNYM